MPWCPNCKNEYVEGITLCADCGAKLVENLEDVLPRDGQPYGEEYSDREEYEAADGAEVIDGLDEGDGEESGNVSDGASSRVWHSAYQNSAQKAEENKSSAYTLLIVGALGLIASVLVLAGVIPLYQNAVTTRYFVCGVMGALFLLFIILGIISMKNFKTLSVKAESEDSLVSEITKWCGENLSAGGIDEGLFGMEEIPEEQKYFKRTEKMKLLIQAKYINLEEDFLDSFVDDYYQNLF